MSGMSRTILGFISLFMIVLFQNCTQNEFHTDPAVTASAASEGGNGEPYSGKITVYHSYAPGFTCVNDAGEAVASPYLIINELNGVFKLVEKACVKMDEIIPKNEITYSADGSLQYQSRSLQEIISGIDIKKVDFNYREVSCKETDKSRILRTFGYYPISQAQMPNAETDLFYASILSNSKYERIANVYLRKAVRVFNPGEATAAPAVGQVDAIKVEVAPNSTIYSQSLKGFRLSVASSVSGVIFPVIPGAFDYTPYGISNAEMECQVFPLPTQYSN